MSDPRIIVALDYPAPDAALHLAERLSPASCRLKVGKELFGVGGPTVVAQLIDRGYDVFLDLKYHDIPNTVAGACRAAARLGVWMLNVHALGGRRMMTAAREALDVSPSRPLLVAVTVLTSMNAGDLEEIGLRDTPEEAVLRLASLAKTCGLDGVVCSAHEAAALRLRLGAGFRLVTPGIRPSGTAADDQQRVTTPLEAVTLGVDYLVVGRPITQAPDPAAVLAAIHAQLAGAARRAQR